MSKSLDYLLGIGGKGPARLEDHPGEIAEFLWQGLAELRSRLGTSTSLRKLIDRAVKETGWELPRPDFEELSIRLRTLEPGAARAYRSWKGAGSIPSGTEQPEPFLDSDFEILDRVFREILPADFAGTTGDARDYYRPAQAGMAGEIASALGGKKFLLLDSPTGTGKTLAYLAPALLFAARAGVRVGVSTYTRALQEQAYERELPRALAALKKTGMDFSFRTTLIKGRHNYLCWKRIRTLLPDLEEPPEEFLAWLLVARFALLHPTGDFDSLDFPPARFPLGKDVAEHLQRLRRNAACARDCCRGWDEKRHCCFEIACRRAERSHLVVTNHAFVFAAPDFFRHLVFDEAEHLHHQAVSSETVDFRPRSLEWILRDLSQGKNLSPKITRRPGPLDHFRKAGNLLAAEWGPRAPEALAAWDRVTDALEDFRFAVDEFETWREEERQKRSPERMHSLLREFAVGPEGQRLYRCRDRLLKDGEELVQALDLLLEDLLTAPLRGAAGIRARISQSKQDLEENLGRLDAALPVENGKFLFDDNFFFDVEKGSSRKVEPYLVRRILLPDAWLAKGFWPQLESAAMLSATARLHGGFESTANYLGLSKIPGYQTHHAPDPFDYERVLFAVPTDAPRYHAGREGREKFQSFVTTFLLDLCRKTLGRCLVLFTNAFDLEQAARRLGPLFEKTGIELLYQGMDGLPKEQLADKFRESRSAVLFGLDTFWYGVDFPGDICEYVVLVKLPYGQLDRYYFAQREVLGDAEHRKRIYLPRALSMFRQGFGRLLRTKEDRGAVFLLDRRVLESRHRFFLEELPGGAMDQEAPAMKTLLSPSRRCIEAALEHMNLTAATQPPSSGKGWTEQDRVELVD